MEPRSMLIVNPVSGKGRVKGFLMDILSTLCVGGAGVAVYMTEKQGDAMSFAQTHGAEYDRIACTGGDGTLNEVISGLMLLEPEQRPAIGYIPLGTTNDMASSLNLPKTPQGAIARLGYDPLFQEPRFMDIGSLGKDFFGYVAAFGAFTDIPFTTPQEAKNTWGYLAYVTEALGRLAKIPSIHARVDSDEGAVEDDFLVGFVVNSTRVAGGIVKLSEEDVSLDDGVFEILLVRTPKKPGDLSQALTQMLRQDFNTDQITLLHTKKALFTFDEPVQWTRDGEDGGFYKSVEVVNYQRAVKFFV